MKINKECLEMKYKIFGANAINSTIAISLNNLGGSYSVCGDNQKAL